VESELQANCTGIKFGILKRQQHFYFYSREMLRMLCNGQKQKECEPVHIKQ
jgi:hypothetical protein